jgi:hypothetical protein
MTDRSQDQVIGQHEQSAQNFFWVEDMPGERPDMRRHHPDRQHKSFRLIDPDDYERLGINPDDVPMGTFAAEDHPTFLPTRFGGNAYGLGVVEQEALTSEDAEFFESLDYQDAEELGRSSRRLNAILQKLGLLFRFSRSGKTFYLIPINLVAHSLHQIKTKANEIERLVIQYMFEARAEQLKIGLLTRSHDLLVHELTARLTIHRIFLFESIEAISSSRASLDIVILPKDPFEYLLEQKLPKPLRKRLDRHTLLHLSAYLAVKIFDLLEPGGRVVLLSHLLDPQKGRSLPSLKLRFFRKRMKDPEKQWKLLFGPFFATRYLRQKLPRDSHQAWNGQIDLEGELRESLLVYVGERRQPEVTLPDLELDLHRSRMQGCSLPLVADYRNSFQYVLDVLRILTQIRDRRLTKQSALEQSRLSNPFLTKNESLHTLAQLLGQIHKLERIHNTLNPENFEGRTTPILENVGKLSLYGFSREQLLEILLIVVGHSTMSRVVFGKTPARTLKPVTDKMKQGPSEKILELLRFCRLMSMAEIIASFKDTFTQEHSRELFHLYDAAIAVATDPWLDWEKLQDLRISALGGVRNMAIREMMKFFNLFEFLDDWQEIIRKGSSEREVICDYEPEKLRQMEEAIELSLLAAQFDHEQTGRELFGRSRFFRQFLETEFHGTGHLFPMLGAKAGFMLIWIAVNSSERHIVNFNPILAKVPEDLYEERIVRIRDALLKITQDMLAPPFFDQIRNTIAEGLPAFVLTTGIRVMNNHKTGATEVSFVDVAEDIHRIEALLRHFERQKLTAISVKQLHELERLFSELESFHRGLHRNPVIPQNDWLRAADSDDIENTRERDSRIERIRQRLRTILHNHIFVPGEIYDSVNSLVRYCPEILRFVMPDFHSLQNIPDEYPTSRIQFLGDYVMRCLRKFQALTMRDHNGFQDRNTFYQLAKEEFGPLAEEGIGANYSQLEVLEQIVEALQRRPLVLKALMVALLFQEIGKNAGSYSVLSGSEELWTRGERGAQVLEQTDILQSYNLDPQLKDFVILFIRHQGLIREVFLGEEPILALERLTVIQDEQLFDAFVIQAVLATAAVEEGLMISDLLEGFLYYLTIGRQIIKSNGSWQNWLEESLKGKGKAVIPALSVTGSPAEPSHPKSRHFLDSNGDVVAQDDLRRGRKAAALERLLRLLGVYWVDFQDLQMFLSKMPITFIYYKKKLKSVGLQTFEKELRDAAKVFELVSLLNSEVQISLLFSLDHLGGSVHIRDFHYLPEFLEIEGCVKLLVISLTECHRHFGPQAENSLMCFGNLSRNIERIHTALQRDLRNLPFPVCLSAPERQESYDRDHAGILFRAHPEQRAIEVDYCCPVNLDLMVQSLSTLWDRELLHRRLNECINELRQKLAFDPKEFESALRKSYGAQRERINDRVLEECQARLTSVLSFRQFHELRQELDRQQEELEFSDAQRFALGEMIEFHRSRIRDRYLDSIYLRINNLHSREDLLDLWNTLKYELLSFRAYLGKEFELLIAQLIDQKLDSM